MQVKQHNNTKDGQMSIPYAYPNNLRETVTDKAE